MSLRIISGKYKGQTIDAPNVARPTLSRHRQSLFDSLESMVDIGSESFFYGKIVIDCFAGSGALGIESLSRGAKHVYFIDNNRESISVLRHNTEKLKVLDSSTIVLSEISKIKNIDKKIADLVFLDPPYEESHTLIAKTISHLLNLELISENTILVIETSGKSDILQQHIFDFEILLSRKIGNSLFSIVKCVQQKR